MSDLLLTGMQAEMIVKRSGMMGGSQVAFELDDVTREVVKVSITNLSPNRVLTIEMPKGTFSVDPGQTLSRALNPAQRQAYTVEAVARLGQADKEMLAFPHRIYFSEPA